MGTGGTPFHATTLFASGTGPLAEEEAPYRNEENVADVKLNPGNFKTRLFTCTSPIDLDSEKNAPYDRFVAIRDIFAFDPSDSAMEGIDLTGLDPSALDLIGLNLDGLDQTIIAGPGVRQKTVTEELAQSGTLESYAARPTFDANGLFVCADNDNLRDYDWSLPLSKRLAISVELEESTCLPSPAAVNEDGRYYYDANATAAIKRELMAGRGVHIEFCSDQSLPGQELPEGSYLNPETWSHYSYDKIGYGDKVSLDHDVCIVGWDDNWGVENFNQGTFHISKTGADVNRFPPAPGAWIVKNSWGAKGVGFPNEGDWGINSTGYFYLSYYDMSIDRPTTYNYYTKNLDDEREEVFVNQYDFLSCSDAQTKLFDIESSIANVFTAEADQLVRTLSVETNEPNTHVVLSLYRLNGTTAEATDESQPNGTVQDVTDPTAGELLETVVADYPNGGYHRLQLTKSHYMTKGQRFSVVGTMTVDTDDGIKYAIPARSWYNAHSQEMAGYSGLDMIGKGVINKGESFVLGEGKWEDWTSVAADLQAIVGDVRDYDNFALKAFADENIPFALTKVVVDQKEAYYPGDEVRYRVTVRNEGPAELRGVVIADSLVELGESGRIENVPAGEERSVEYVYKVTEEDAARGSVANTATATLENVEGLSATANASVKCAARPALEPEPEKQASTPASQASAPAPQPAPSTPAPVRSSQTSTSKKTLANTGDESIVPLSLALVAAALGSMAYARRLRRP